MYHKLGRTDCGAGAFPRIPGDGQIMGTGGKEALARIMRSWPAPGIVDHLFVSTPAAMASLLRHPRLFATLLLAACHSTPSPPTPFPSVSTAFQISSIQSDYLVRGQFWGHVAQDAGGIQVLVDSLYLPAPRAPGISIGTIRLRAGLASTTTRGGWAFRGFGNTVALRESGMVGDTLLGPLRFTIPLPHTFDLAIDYLAFEFAFPSPRESSGQASTTYACGAPGMLARPMRSVASAAVPRSYAEAC
jgi:hypothetical protein